MSIALFAALVLGFSQETPPQDDATALPDITVSGARPTVSQTRRFVDEIATTPRHALTLARWITPICIAPVNLQPEMAAQIVTRIEDRARSVGVEVQPAGCSPNITLLATSDGRFSATELVDAHHDRFMASSGPTQGEEDDLRRFAQSDAVVRWWTISALMDENTKQILVPIWGAPAPISSVRGMDFFGQDRREALLTSLVILDLSKTETVSPAALGDYLSMVVLTPLDPELRAGGYPSILGLWDGGQTATELMPWDRAYLTALYEAEVRLSGSTLQTRSLFQLNEMARIMARELGEDDPAP
ncbi:hypothetical protein [Brevundimonas sp.]